MTNYLMRIFGKCTFIKKITFMSKNGGECIETNLFVLEWRNVYQIIARMEVNV